MQRWSRLPPESLLRHSVVVAITALLLGPSLPGPHGCSVLLAADIEAGEDAVVLEEDLQIDLVSASTARVSYLNRTKVLTARGASRFSVASVDYNPSVTIRDLRAAVISPEGKRSEVKKQQISDGAAFASYELYSDDKRRSISFPGAVPGAILEYRYELDVRDLFYLQKTFALQDTIPARSLSLTVRLPVTIPLRFTVRGSPEYTREDAGGALVHRWRVRDVPALKDEYVMPPRQDVFPRVDIYPKEISWHEQRIDATNWNGIARWIWELARDRVTPKEEVARTARELTAGLTDPTEMTRRIYEFAQGKINYVAIELGVGGYQPHDSAAVLKYRYGDCKDKATLLVSMLKAVGLRGYLGYINTRDKGLTDRDYPDPSFNHAIVAVPREDGYLFMDPTDESTAFGDLPWVDQGANVLVIKEDGTGELVETPLFPPESNRIHWLVTATIGPTGDLEGSCLVQAWGQKRAEFAAFAAETKPTEREDALAGFMARISPGSVLDAQEVVVPDRPGDPLRATLRFRVPRSLVRAGGLEILSPHLVRFPFVTRITAYPHRRHPIFFNYLFSETSEVRLYLPPGRALKKLPAGNALEGPGLKASTEYELKNEAGRNILVVKRSLTVSRREIPITEYPALRQLLASVTEEESRAVTLQSDM